MNVTELSQIQIDVEDHSPALAEKLASEVDHHDPLWPTIKIIIGRFLHRFGVHTWVRWRHYDAASDRVIDMNGVICQWCPKAKLR